MPGGLIVKIEIAKRLAVGIFDAERFSECSDGGLAIDAWGESEGVAGWSALARDLNRDVIFRW